MSTVVRCRSCHKKNRVPAAATGTPRCRECKAPIAWTAEATVADWNEVVDAAPVPVLVDLWAPWCGPCHMVSPILEDLAAEYAGRIKLVKVNVDRSPEISRRFSVQGIPTLLVVDRGKVLARQTGAAGADALRRWVDGALATART